MAVLTPLPRRTAGVGLCLVLATTVAAAEDGEQPARARIERVAEADLGIQFLSGASELTGLSAGLRLLRRSPLLETIIDGDVDYLRSGDRVLRRYGFLGSTIDLWPRARRSPFALATWTKDQRREIDDRLQVGVGIKQVLDGPDGDGFERGKHSISLAVLWESESPTSDDLERREGFFASLRLKDRWSIGDRSTLSSVVFLQPALGDPERYRVIADLSLEVPISSALSLRVSARDEYDSQPLRPTIDENQVVTRLTVRYRRSDETALAPAASAGAVP